MNFLENALRLWKSTNTSGTMVTDEWQMYAIEHPNIDKNRFLHMDTWRTPQLNVTRAEQQLSSLRHPFQLFSPVKAAQETVEKFSESFFL